ncbi:MAG: hypothetical protein ACRD6B_01235, partial [Bryobacteraceae bacterium]
SRHGASDRITSPLGLLHLPHLIRPKSPQQRDLNELLFNRSTWCPQIGLAETTQICVSSFSISENDSSGIAFTLHPPFTLH